MTGAQRERAAAQAVYMGSPEHKLPQARSDATLCPSDLRDRRDQLTQWLREGLLNGHAGGCIEGNFPRYVWYRVDGLCFEGRLTNQTLGEYKGYPIQVEEWPEALA